MNAVDKQSPQYRKRLAKQYGLDWWWLEIAKWKKPRRDWFYAAAERSAYIYELSGRVYGQFEFAAPWVKLDRHQQSQLTDRWPQRSDDSWDACHMSPEQLLARKDAEDWFYPYNKNGTFFDCVSWNLGKSDERLVKCFLAYIKSEREQHGIHPDKRGFKPRSWRPIELWDIDAKKIWHLNGSERSQLRKEIERIKSI